MSRVLWLGTAFKWPDSKLSSCCRNRLCRKLLSLRETRSHGESSTMKLTVWSVFCDTRIPRAKCKLSAHYDGLDRLLSLTLSRALPTYVASSFHVVNRKLRTIICMLWDQGYWVPIPNPIQIQDLRILMFARTQDRRSSKYSKVGDMQVTRVHCATAKHLCGVTGHLAKNSSRFPPIGGARLELNTITDIGTVG